MARNKPNSKNGKPAMSEIKARSRREAFLTLRIVLAWRIATLGATQGFHHGLLATQHATLSFKLARPGQNTVEADVTLVTRVLEDRSVGSP